MPVTLSPPAQLALSWGLLPRIWTINSILWAMPSRKIAVSTAGGSGYSLRYFLLPGQHDCSSQAAIARVSLQLSYSGASLHSGWKRIAPTPTRNLIGSLFHENERPGASCGPLPLAECLDVSNWRMIRLFKPVNHGSSDSQQHVNY